MNRTPVLLTPLAIAISVSLTWSADARAQPPKQPDVDMPRIELATAVAVKRTIDTVRADRTWRDPNVSVSIGRHVSRQVAAAAQVETGFDRSATVLGGLQLGTDFFYGSGRDPVPGRFFGRVLAGVVTGDPRGVHPACQVGGGADILVSRTRGIGVRWEAGYEFIAGGVPQHVNGRLAIGLVFGPRLRSHGRTTIR